MMQLIKMYNTERIDWVVEWDRKLAQFQVQCVAGSLLEYPHKDAQWAA